MCNERLPLLCYFIRHISAALLSFFIVFHSLPSYASLELSKYYSEVPTTLLDSTYEAVGSSLTTHDLNGDGHEDLIILGEDYPHDGQTNYAPQPGRVLLGDGNGNFQIASSDLFPVDGLMTVAPRKVMFGDLNGDGRQDMFIASHGWDAEPFPGGQNRLMLSKASGGWEDATATLPQLTDFTHAAAIGDVDGDGDIDIFVGNGYDTEILSYFLINDGQGNLTLDRSIIPVEDGDILSIGSQFPGSILEDLNGDNLPELILTADASEDFNTLRENTILWNTGGAFSQNNKTTLPIQSVFQNSYIVLDVALVDANNDNLSDLIFIGTQGEPFYDSWFVQLLINKGNNQYLDETTSWINSDDMSGGTPGVSTGTTWPVWIKVLDFNNDGLQDFSVEYNNTGYISDMPFVWLNDGMGHFTTLEVQDIVTEDKKYLLGGIHLTPTVNGFSIFDALIFEGSGGLLLHGLLATKPVNTPTVITTIVSNFGNTSAIGGGEVVDDGGAAVTSRGICWSTSPNPTTEDKKVTNGSGFGIYESSMTELSANTTYYVRSWATSLTGTGYGNEVTFTTLEGLPTLTTLAVLKSKNSNAISGGNVLNDGGIEVTSRGVCWSTSANPTILDQKTIDGSGMGAFQSSLTDLAANTTYYVRAWATNSYGTNYGNEVVFSDRSPWILFLVPVISQPRRI